jgi:hypothetical protein
MADFGEDQAIQPAPGEQRGQPKASSSGGAMGETNGDAGSMSADPAKAPKGSELTPSSKAKGGVSAHRGQSASQKAVVKAVNGFAGQTLSQLLQTNTARQSVAASLFRLPRRRPRDSGRCPILKVRSLHSCLRIRCLRQ